MKKRLLSFLLLAISFQFVAFSQTAEGYYDKAKQKIQEKDYNYAMVMIEKAIELDDTDIWYYLLQSEIQIELTNWKDAMRILNKAIALDTQRSEPYNRAGNIYSSIGYMDSSIYMFNKAIEYAENDTIKSHYLLNRGTSKAFSRDFYGAIDDYLEVLEFNPNDVAALNNIAPAYREIGKTNESIKSLNRLIELDSMVIGPYVNLGFVYTSMDSLDIALTYFNIAAKFDPEDPLVYNNRGHVYYKKKEYSKALVDINESIRIYPSNAYAYRNLALVYIDTKNIDEACKALEYAEYYRFEQLYGSEVSELIDKHCK